MKKEGQVLPMLPDVFLSRMKIMLGAEYPDFLKSYQEKRTFGLRVNTLKISCEEFEQIVPFPIRRIPWVENGYFYEEESRPARCPLYQAGLYYLQEPSAMTPASRIPIEPGDFVLDLCAAPGGKATALGAALKGRGLLVANDISASRAKALLRNLELFGITNALVTNETPENLLSRFPGFFHKIVLDAPCSGEGMFRKEEALARDWTPEKSAALSETQRRLILQAADMLAPGGELLYSTCTFAPIEDEAVISWLLTERPEMELADIRPYEGFTPGTPAWGSGEPNLAGSKNSGLTGSESPNFPSREPPVLPGNTSPDLAGSINPDLSKCVRIFPHKMPGEGHFLALTKKRGAGADSLSAAPCRISEYVEPSKTEYGFDKENSSRKAYKNSPKRPGNRKSRTTGEAPAGLSGEYRALLESFFTEIGLKTLGGKPFDWSRLEIRSDRAYYLPPVTPDIRGLNFLRCGLYLGDFKKNRFEPSEPFALALLRNDISAVICLPLDDPRLDSYLHGNPIPLRPEESPSPRGWHLLCAGDYPLAFGKLANQTLKNKYPAGWRL